jgi:hypothetical protein
MKYINIAITVLCITGIFFINSPSFAQDVKLVPDIKFSEVKHDFGTIAQKEQLSYVYKFRNIGQGNLMIKNIRVACGCAAALISAKEIPPKGEGELKVIFYSQELEGKVVKYIYVSSNDPDEQIVKLEIEAYVKPIMMIDPKRLYLGNIQKGQSITKDLRVTPNEDNLRVTRVESTSKYIAATLSESVKEDKKTYLIDVTVSPETPLGRIYEKLKIYTDSPKQNVMDIAIQGNILGGINLVPEVFSFGTIQKGDNISKKILVTKTDAKALKILNVKSNIKWILTRISAIEEGKRYEIIVSVSPDAPLGRIDGKINIQTDDTQQSLLTVSVFGFVKT